MQPLNASDFLPQRPPFILVDRMLDCTANSCRTDFLVPEVHPLLRHGYLNEAGVLENIAQTCATHIGYQSRFVPIRIGVVASGRNVVIHSLPKVGTRLETVVEEQGEPIFSVSIYLAKVMADDELVAEGEIRVVLTDMVPAS